MILPKDVENLIADMRAKAYTSSDVNSRVKQLLHDLCAEPGNVANTYRDEHKKTRCITFQTRHIRSMFSQFSEVLCVDATYGTNANK